MQIRTYMDLSDVIADLARLDKAIQRKRYVAIRDALDQLPHSDDSIEEASDLLKMLRSILEEVADTEDGRPTFTDEAS